MLTCTENTFTDSSKLKESSKKAREAARAFYLWQKISEVGGTSIPGVAADRDCGWCSSLLARECWSHEEPTGRKTDIKNSAENVRKTLR